MFYVPGSPDQPLKQNPFKAIVVPRPIGWITTLNEEGGVNLAPYSFFNAIAESPPCVMYASTLQNCGAASKNTLRNIERTGEFVVNVASSELREAVRSSATALPYGESELSAAGLSSSPSSVIATPRVAEARAALECRLLQSMVVPGTGGRHQASAVFGQVVAMFIADDIVADGIVAPHLLKPLCRLGYDHYAVLEEVFRMDVPQ